MVSDTEPRYRLVDSNGNVVGSLYVEADGTLKLQEGTSGSDNEVSVATDGTFTAPAVSTDKVTIGGTLYEIDGGINVTGETSVSYSLSNSPKKVYIWIDASAGFGFDELTVNGAASDYHYEANDGTQTSGASEWAINQAVGWIGLWVSSNGNRITLNVPRARTDDGAPTVGGTVSATGPITQFALSQSSGLERDFKARVFRRSVDL